MRLSHWFGTLWKRLSLSVVQEVPAGLEECEACRETECTRERWDACERRLAAQAALQVARFSGKTAEMPGLAADGAGAASAGDDQVADDQAETPRRDLTN